MSLESKKEARRTAKQEFENIFSDFSSTVKRIDGSTQEITTNLRAKFSNREFTIVTDSSKTIVSEKLPSAFYMHPIRVGIDQINNQPIVMIVNKSRATTGR